MMTLVCVFVVRVGVKELSVKMWQCKSVLEWDWGGK